MTGTRHEGGSRGALSPEAAVISDRHSPSRFDADEDVSVPDDTGLLWWKGWFALGVLVALWAWLGVQAWLDSDLSLLVVASIVTVLLSPLLIWCWAQALSVRPGAIVCAAEGLCRRRVLRRTTPWTDIDGVRVTETRAVVRGRNSLRVFATEIEHHGHWHKVVGTGRRSAANVAAQAAAIDAWRRHSQDDLRGGQENPGHADRSVDENPDGPETPPPGVLGPVQAFGLDELESGCAALGLSELSTGG